MRYFKLYCWIIALIITMPLVGTVVHLASNKTLLREPELSGVTDVPSKPELSLNTLESGQFQSDFEKYFEYHLVSRRVQTRLYNQLLYSLFRSTDNSSILVGRNGYLYEKPYATAYFTEPTPEHTAALKENISKLARLSELLKERGVPLVVRMSPSKAEHYPEYLPLAYSRFVKMKQEGQYASNWYQVFSEEIKKTDVPVYDRYDLMQQMKEDGEVVFAKGGTHWTLAPMAEYINGLNVCMEGLLNRKLGRMIVDWQEVMTGNMGIAEDSDIWQICWNALFDKPNYPSPHVSFSTVPGEAPLRVFTVGQSFTTVLLRAIYSAQPPVWDETYFSWYDTRVMKFPSDVPWGTQISDQTDDFEQYLEMDIILIDFLESGDGACQFEFVDHMLQYLERNEVAS